MRDLFGLLLILCLAAKLVSPALAGPPAKPNQKRQVSAPSGVKRVLTPAKYFPDVRHVPYISGGGSKQTLDIYLPKQGGKHPILLYVHGGGWYGGSKGEATRYGMGRSFAQKGILVVSIDYRLTATDKYPAFMEDLAAAVRWTKSHISNYGGDPDKLFLIGHSAGGHMVSLLATHPCFLSKNGLTPGDLAGVIPLDATSYDLVDQSGSPIYHLEDVAFGDDPAVRADASPIRFVNADTLYPPFLIPVRQLQPGNGDHDDLAESLRRHGNAAITFAVLGKTHESIRDDLGKASDPVTLEIEKFIDRICRTALKN